MEYRLLGKSSLPISEIGFGCMSLNPADEDINSLIHEAIDQGINFFDTADIYQKGLNEELLGKALKGKREDVIIASKVGNVWKEDGSGLDWNPSPDHIRASIEGSLARLNVSYIDLYQLHGGTLEDPIEETIATFDALVKEGKIRYYGISSIRPNVIRQWIEKSSMVSVMMQYSLVDRRPEEDCLHLLLDNRIGVLARGSLASGMLTGKEPKEYLGHSVEDMERAARAVKQVANRERNKIETAIRFVLDHPAISSAVVGIRTREQLADLVGTHATPKLSAQELRILTDAAPAKRYQDHR